MSLSDDFLKDNSCKLQEIYAKFIMSLNDGFALLELILNGERKIVDFAFLDVNPAFETQMGVKAANIVGKRKNEIPLALEQRFYDYAAQTVKVGKTLSYQFHSPKIDAYYEAQFIAIPPNQVAVLFKNVTARKKAEDALTKTKENLESIIKQSPMAFALFDKDGFLVQVNDAWDKQWQIPRELVIGKYNVLTSGQVSSAGLLPDVQKVYAGETVRSFELEFDASSEPIVHGFGRKRWLSVTAYPVKGETGAVNIAVLSEDITERKKTEETLRNSEQRYRELYESFDEAFIVTDWEFNVKNWNKAAERVTTVAAKDALGKKVYDVLPEMLTVDVGPYFDSLKEKKPARFMMNVISRQTKKPSIFEISTYPSDLGITVIVEDKTEEEETKRLSVIGATAGMVGHDIRNPLQVVMSDTYLLEDALASMPEGKTKADVAESLESIEKNIIYINKIVQDLQDYSRAIKPDFSEANLSDVFANIFKTVNLPDVITLVMHIKEVEKIKTDPLLLQRALTNLVTNAIQAMPDGGRLEINGGVRYNRLIITVADTGVGIPEEVKSKLFTPMVTTKARGQGFGLAVSKRLIEALKGTISFESEMGKGTKFTVELPI